MNALAPDACHRFPTCTLPDTVLGLSPPPTSIVRHQDREDCRDAARGLIDRSLLQAVGSSDYRVHDLLLDFVKDSVKPAPLKRAASRQAKYLGRLDVVNRFATEGTCQEGLYSLMALWRPVERLSSNPRVQVDAYRAHFELLVEEKHEDVAFCHWAVGRLLEIEVRKEM